MTLLTAIAVSAVMQMQPMDASPQLTVYNGGFALVKERRALDVRTGRQSVTIENVAERIEPSSVGIRSLTAPGSFSVLEQNYQFDLISTRAILNKAVGGRIVFNRVLPNGAKERVSGTLLSAPTAVVGGADGGSTTTYNGMVIRTDDGRILLDPSGEIEVSSIPEGLISRPSLVWLIEGARAGAQTIELSYLTQAISWSADYVLSLDAAGTVADLKGWVTIDNQSGGTWENARLTLLAGDVQRAQPPARDAMMRQRGETAGFGAPGGFQQEQFADYHLYVLGRPATVRNREIKQISLLESTGVPMTKRLVVDPLRRGGRIIPQPGDYGTGKFKPQIQLVFTNNQASKLGMPLPQGTVKVYQRDSRGDLQMLGEDRIDHTPREEKVTLTVGSAFDVVAERKRTSFEYVGTNSGGGFRAARETFEIELRNRKETPETVFVIERHHGDFRITSESIPSRKLDANTLEFEVKLAPNEVKKITYTVESRW